jgi:hypothetical protein
LRIIASRCDRFAADIGDGARIRAMMHDPSPFSQSEITGNHLANR